MANNHQMVAFSGDELAAPLLQHMNLEDHDSVTVVQQTQWAEIFIQLAGIPYEQANKYKIGAVPDGVRAASSPDDPQRWRPERDEMNALPAVLLAAEESSCLERLCTSLLGCLHLRSFTMHFTDVSGHEHIRLERPFRLGGECGCPLETLVLGGSGRTIGRVDEDFSPYAGKCFEICCRCTGYTDVSELQEDGSMQHVFTIRTNLLCCGRVNNCCGATCCKDSAVYDIMTPPGTGSAVVGHVQKMYGGKGASACCRMAAHLNSYVLDFPPHSTAAQRSLLLGGLMHMNYAYHEKKGDDSK